MKCPSCETEIADDSIVCPNCEAVVDASLLNAAPPETDDEDTGREPVAARPASKPKMRKVVKKAPEGATPSKRPPPAQSGKRVPPGSMPEAPAAGKAKRADDWRKDVAPEDWGNSLGPAAPVAPKQKTLDADDYLGQFKHFVTGLTLADKLAFFGSVATFIVCFLPWKDSVTEGDSLGIGSAGFLVAITSLAAIVCVILRYSKSVTMNPMLLWVGQLGSAGFGVLWSFICIRLAWDSTLVHASIGNQQVYASKPSFGVFFAILSGVIAVVGTVLGLKESQNK